MDIKKASDTSVFVTETKTNEMPLTTMVQQLERANNMLDKVKQSNSVRETRLQSKIDELTEAIKQAKLIGVVEILAPQEEQAISMLTKLKGFFNK